MTPLDLLRQRSFNQQLTRPRLTHPTELVAWFGAVQAQEYRDTLWAVGQRLRGATEAAVERAFNSGALIRTHVMRPTWHFVAPADLRWLLALTGPRVHQINQTYYRRFELDAALFKRAHAVFERALRDGQFQTRNALNLELQAAGIKREGPGLAYIFMHAELEGLICSGPRQGKQFTYALVDERVPPAPPLGREAALAELVRRYFQSHGPAQAHDFAWWSGLTVADARAGLELVGSQLARAAIDGKDYWYVPARPPAIPSGVYLLTTYDESGVAYKDRSALASPDEGSRIMDGYSTGYPNMLVGGGRVVGLWRREFEKDSARLYAQYWRGPEAGDAEAVTEAAREYAAFLEVPVRVV